MALADANTQITNFLTAANGRMIDDIAAECELSQTANLLVQASACNGRSGQYSKQCRTASSLWAMKLGMQPLFHQSNLLNDKEVHAHSPKSNIKYNPYQGRIKMSHKLTPTSPQPVRASIWRVITRVYKKVWTDCPVVTLNLRTTPGGRRSP